MIEWLSGIDDCCDDRLEKFSRRQSDVALGLERDNFVYFVVYSKPTDPLVEIVVGVQASAAPKPRTETAAKGG
jgi:hypothetical protein